MQRPLRALDRDLLVVGREVDALGLGAVITVWHLMLEPEFKEVLGIPKDVHTYAVIPIGYPVGRFGPVSRIPATEITRHNHW